MAVRGAWRGSFQHFRFARVVRYLAVVVVVYVVKVEVTRKPHLEHAASTEVGDLRSPERAASRGGDNAFHDETNLRGHGPEDIGDAPEDNALLLTDHYKRLHRPDLSLAGWQKVCVCECGTAPVACRHMSQRRQTVPVNHSRFYPKLQMCYSVLHVRTHFVHLPLYAQGFANRGCELSLRVNLGDFRSLQCVRRT